ncbi:hypothetical protein B0H17DRAFT_1215889 [Mycena rosella]|uniref:Uncharacterized protein n=1 Tax=Mycena rosella TaxID=1033263 RepID=A0AAD7CD55_MYCRO|nr:hypothetical protein B0H17DRAFT_1215889 [Mycena rosella]
MTVRFDQKNLVAIGPGSGGFWPPSNEGRTLASGFSTRSFALLTRAICKPRTRRASFANAGSSARPREFTHGLAIPVPHSAAPSSSPHTHIDYTYYAFLILFSVAAPPCAAPSASCLQRASDSDSRIARDRLSRRQGLTATPGCAPYAKFSLRALYRVEAHRPIMRLPLGAELVSAGRPLLPRLPALSDKRSPRHVRLVTHPIPLVLRPNAINVQWQIALLRPRDLLALTIPTLPALIDDDRLEAPSACPFQVCAHQRAPPSPPPASSGGSDSLHTPPHLGRMATTRYALASRPPALVPLGPQPAAPPRFLFTGRESETSKCIRPRALPQARGLLIRGYKPRLVSPALCHGRAGRLLGVIGTRTLLVVRPASLHEARARAACPVGAALAASISPRTQSRSPSTSTLRSPPSTYTVSRPLSLVAQSSFTLMHPPNALSPGIRRRFKDVPERVGDSAAQGASRAPPAARRLPFAALIDRLPSPLAKCTRLTPVLVLDRPRLDDGPFFHRVSAASRRS